MPYNRQAQDFRRNEYRENDFRYRYGSKRGIRNDVTRTARDAAYVARSLDNTASRGIRYDQYGNERRVGRAGVNAQRAAARQLRSDLARTDQRNMDAGTRKAMQNHYYRQGRRANGLSAG